MKRYIYKSILVLASLAVAAGCIKETFPEGGSQVKDQVSNSPFALNGILRGLPSSMTATNTAGYVSTYGDHTDFGIGAIHLMTEFMLNDLATLSDNPYYNRFYSSSMNQNQDNRYIYCAYYWQTYYPWIKICNDIISVVDPETENAEEMNYLGQAYAYRAYFYLDLARIFEPKKITDEYAISKGYSVPEELLGLTVPIVTETLDEKQASNNPRAPREKMYEFILSDLEKAENLLKDMKNTRLEPTVQLVYGLKARTYVEMGYWPAEEGDKPDYSKVDKEAFANAAKYARLAIEGSGAPLTKEQWQSTTTGFNSVDANPAWIWGLPLTTENQGNIITYTAHIASEATWGYAPRSAIGIDRKFYESIPDSDWRKASWVSPEYFNNPDAPEFKDMYKIINRNIFLYGDAQLQIPACLPYINIKFRPAQGKIYDYNVGNCADHCLMRVEEMYFLEAEALAHSQGIAAGKNVLESFIKTHRNPKYICAATNSMESFLIDELLYQKRIEFWGEGILFYDYKRLNAGINRGYAGTNHPSVYRLNCTGRSPQWNIVITRGETQSNNGITDELNNPDPSDKMELWKE